MDIVKDIIFPVLNEFKEDENLDFELSENLELYGNDSIFDSISLVRFIINIQDKILEITDKDVMLVTSDIMRKSESPFKTVHSMAIYIKGLLND